jgi:3-hydroxybutyrate dehydrogenase
MLVAEAHRRETAGARERRQGVTATAVCPGFVRIPLVEKQIGDQARAHGLPEDVVLQPHAVKRLIETRRGGGVVSFLLGPDGRAVTGAPVTLDLGWTAR